MRTFFALTAITLSLLISASTHAGIIQTVISSSRRVTTQGAIELEFKIRNNGNTTAHDLAVTFIMGSRVRCFDQLGDNPPGGEIYLEERIPRGVFVPGTYVGVVRAAFEDSGGTPHHVSHFFDMSYLMGPGVTEEFSLSLRTEAPRFNRKAFWARQGWIRLFMSNKGNTQICANVWLFLPEGFTSDRPNHRIQLYPGEKRIQEIPLRLQANGKGQSTYHLIVWYNNNHIHHAAHLAGVLTVDERPVYFKGYMVLAGAIWGGLLGILVIRNRRASMPHSTNESLYNP